MKPGVLISILLLVLTLAVAIMRGADATTQGAGGEDAVRELFRQSYDLEKQAKYPDAIAALKNAPQGYMLEMRLGRLLYLSGDYATAEVHYLVAATRSPNSLEAKLAYLQPLLAEKRYADLEKKARIIVRIDPDNYYGNLHLLYALRGEAKYDQADETATHMAALYPSDTAFLSELAWAKMGEKQKDAAKRILTQVLQLDPDNALAQQEIAKL